MILFSVLYLAFWCHFFASGSEMGWDANSLSARMLHLLHQFVLGLYSVTLVLPTSSNTAYSLSGIGRFDKSLPCPHEDEQEQRFSSASIKFLMWNIYEIIHIGTAGEDESEEW